MKKMLLAIVGSLILSPAFAADQVRINYSNLDLATPAGADVLYRRIERAAKTVCRSFPLEGVRHYRVWRSCYRSAIERAVAEVDDVRLTARHRRGMAPAELYSSRSPAN
jgi:UrcA family protein